MGDVEQSRARLEKIAADLDNNGGTFISAEGSRFAKDLRVVLQALADREAECERLKDGLVRCIEQRDGQLARAETAEAQVADLSMKLAGLVEACGPFIAEAESWHDDEPDKTGLTGFWSDELGQVVITLGDFRALAKSAHSAAQVKEGER